MAHGIGTMARGGIGFRATGDGVTINASGSKAITRRGSRSNGSRVELLKRRAEIPRGAFVFQIAETGAAE